MSDWTLGRPDRSEYSGFSAGYVDLVEGGDLLAALSANLEQTLYLLGPVDNAVASSFRYEPGKWTINDVMGHLCDTERILSYRALRLARNDQTPLPGFEQDDYIPAGAFNGRTLTGLLDEFRSIRQSTISLLRGLPLDAWLHQGTVSGNLASVRGLAFVLTGHELHHVRILRERYLSRAM